MNVQRMEYSNPYPYIEKSNNIAYSLTVIKSLAQSGVRGTSTKSDQGYIQSSVILLY